MYEPPMQKEELEAAIDVVGTRRSAVANLGDAQISTIRSALWGRDIKKWL